MTSLTREQRNAIRCLQRLGERWPEGIELFSWSGSLVVIRAVEDPAAYDMHDLVVAHIDGIPNDGGDP